LIFKELSDYYKKSGNKEKWYFFSTLLTGSTAYNGDKIIKNNAPQKYMLPKNNI